ncbi:cytochrome P450 [Laetiporus sulphureus 93-53]|uniref:Cytochrome P450 n=1 Tax=Laetiporus sulphureus 93-53 TaxID=1314785 RepID=A0A165EUR2_9APHY|nr:cytochrome P450 [Laetiporus sulphureus 93-53]KZT07802.1 cytochrome P450 [Laetiporus sulphureus 93-53]
MSSHPSPSVSVWPENSPSSGLTFFTSLSPSITIAAAVLLVSLYLLPSITGTSFDLFGRRPRDKDGNSIPNGPLGLPIVGSFPFLTRYPELTLDYWYKKFGPLYSMWLGNQLFVVFIPKDTVVVMNTWSMHYDETRHPNPDKFDPERYINDSTNNTESANLADPYERDHWMFGLGRRICPGIIVAEREIWLSISRMIWAFNMVEIPSEPIDLKEYDGLSGRSPVPFRIKLVPRHENVAKVLGV